MKDIVNGIGPHVEKIDFENHVSKHYDTPETTGLDWNKIDNDILQKIVTNYSIKSLQDYDALLDNYELNDKYSPEAVKLVNSGRPNNIRKLVIDMFGDPLANIIFAIGDKAL